MTDRSKATTHAEVCWSWGPAHYECAVREIERLRKMHQDAYQRGLQAGSRGLREMYDAIQEVKRQDAWGNTRLTEALMAAEERAERAEAENKRLREELSKMRAEPSDEEIDAIVSKHFQLPGNVSGAYAVIAEVLLSERMRRMAEDAARYRWLRDPCSGAERVIFYCRGDYGRGLMSSAMLDAAIDAAMQEGEA